MGTFAKDEAAILEKLEKSPEGMRSTELFYSVHKTVRSLTTYQKRLRHLKDAGRIQIKDSIDDRRETIITPTPKSLEAIRVLEAITLLEKLYLGKESKKTVLVTAHGERHATETEIQMATGVTLLKIAHETFLKLARETFRDTLQESELEKEFGGSDIYIWVQEERLDPNTDNFRVHTMPVSQVEETRSALDAFKGFHHLFARSLRVWLEGDPTSPLADGWRKMLATIGPLDEIISPASSA